MITIEDAAGGDEPPGAGAAPRRVKGQLHQVPPDRLRQQWADYLRARRHRQEQDAAELDHRDRQAARRRQAVARHTASQEQHARAAWRERRQEQAARRAALRRLEQQEAQEHRQRQRRQRHQLAALRHQAGRWPEIQPPPQAHATSGRARVLARLRRWFQRQQPR